MVILKRMKKQKCDCGRPIAEGSVFCLHCRADVKRKNTQLLTRENKLFAEKY
ncbi:MAG: hypothetical protein NT099_03780 [Candidatus Saganbacteria bacterium]|nr:hypothetical protein [Candidatus Saganbacteria bacterium]